MQANLYCGGGVGARHIQIIGFQDAIARFEVLTSAREVFLALARRLPNRESLRST